MDKQLDKLSELGVFSRWFITLRDPRDILNLHASFLAFELLLYVGGILTFKHAYRLGGRYFYLWLATLFHGLTVESLSYFLPDIDNFWHAQSTVMLLGQRLPLHIICLYPVFIYTASIAVSSLKLSLWSESCAVGLAVVLLDLPMDFLGVKLLWWTWHDTDPNVRDRLYWVPWTSFYFHAAFASTFSFLIHGFRKLLTGKEKYQAAGFIKEFTCSWLTGLLSMPLGVIQFIFFYHVLHDVFKVSTGLCVIVYLILFLLISWSGSRNTEQTTKDTERQSKMSTHFEILLENENYGRLLMVALQECHGGIHLCQLVIPCANHGGNESKNGELLVLVCVYFLFMIATVLLARPETIRSVGLHETIGDCKRVSPVHTPLGMILRKRKYLCAEDYDEDYFDFHCVPEPVEKWTNKEWYTACGTPFGNFAEYLVLVVTSSLAGLYVYYKMLQRGGSDVTQTQYRKSKMKSK